MPLVAVVWLEVPVPVCEMNATVWTSGSLGQLEFSVGSLDSSPPPRVASCGGSHVDQVLLLPRALALTHCSVSLISCCSCSTCRQDSLCLSYAHPSAL